MQEQTSSNSSELKFKIPSASKLKQYRLCPRSVMEPGEYTNVPRIQKIDDSAASIGQRLHSCLQVYLEERINACQSSDYSYMKALSKSKELGVMIQFCELDRTSMEAPCKDAIGVLTEKSMALNSSGKSRAINSYAELTKEDIFVGTADYIIQRKDFSMVIGDWKTGKDDVDSPAENDQLLGLVFLYTGLLSASFAIRMAITNPSLGTHEESELFSQAYIDLDAFKNYSKDKECAGGHCRYCPLKTNCGAFSRMATEEMKIANLKDLNEFQDH